MKPDVSCICLTHGRPWLLAEAIESFQRQKLGGLKAELIVLNDCPEQQIACAIPGVVVFNSPVQAPDLSAKTNDALKLARGRYACLWDDDDISLPDRIADGVTRMAGTLAYRPTLCWSWGCGEIRHMGQPLLCAAIFDREYVLKAGGCVGNGENDQNIWERLYPTRNVVQYAPAPHESQYIYRWAGIGWHQSGSGEKDPRKRAADFHKAAISDRRFTHGLIHVQPMWKRDYVKDVQVAIQQGKGRILR